MKISILVAGTIVVLCSACAPNHNLKDGPNHLGGGGYRVNKVQNGIFQLLVKSNSFLFASSEAVRERWDEKARELCSGGDYLELKVLDTSFSEDKPPVDETYGITRIKARKTGYIACESLGLSKDEITEILNKRGNPIIRRNEND